MRPAREPLRTILTHTKPLEPSAHLYHLNPTITPKVDTVNPILESLERLDDTIKPLKQFQNRVHSVNLWSDGEFEVTKLCQQLERFVSFSKPLETALDDIKGGNMTVLLNGVYSPPWPKLVST